MIVYLKFSQRTFVRQLIVDIIILLENITLILYARNRWLDSEMNSSEQYKTIYKISVAVIIVCHIAAVFLKLLFYSYCHPWSELIRNPETENKGANTTRLFAN